MEPVRGGQGGAGRGGSLEPKLVDVGYGIQIGLGKGLSEPCSPYRSADVFGAELNAVYADNWNCLPEVTEPTESFDLSSLTPYHEVAVALSVFTNIYSERIVYHRWYRTRDNTLLFEYSHLILDPSDYGYAYWSWWYVYSYIGYVPWEINENGNYYWEITIDGATRRIDFTVSGIPAVVPCEITITAPSSAVEGETVEASVKVKNVSPYNYSYKGDIEALPDDYPGYVIGEIDHTIMSGDSVTVDVSFTMPDCNTTIFLWLLRWSFDEWVYDSSGSKVVSLEVPATFHLDIYVPPWAAGGYVEPGSGDYPAYSTVKLTAHPLSGYQFTGWGGDASGTDPTYDLYMDKNKYVEAYFEPVPVPEYKGKIIEKELEYDETRSIIPVY